MTDEQRNALACDVLQKATDVITRPDSTLRAILVVSDAHDTTILPIRLTDIAARELLTVALKALEPHHFTNNSGVTH